MRFTFLPAIPWAVNLTRITSQLSELLSPGDRPFEQNNRDVVGLDPAFAPGASHRGPGGLAPRLVIELIHTMDQPIIGADIVEFNPSCDVSNLTALVAAKVLKEIAGCMVKNSK